MLDGEHDNCFDTNRLSFRMTDKRVGTLGISRFPPTSSSTCMMTVLCLHQGHCQIVMKQHMVNEGRLATLIKISFFFAFCSLYVTAISLIMILSAIRLYKIVNHLKTTVHDWGLVSKGGKGLKINEDDK